MLEAGPAVWGWDEDQCWTLARIAEVVRSRFGVTYTLAGLDLLLHRIGWSVQVPARQAAERDEAAIAAWKRASLRRTAQRCWTPPTSNSPAPSSWCGTTSMCTSAMR